MKLPKEGRALALSGVGRLYNLNLLSRVGRLYIFNLSGVGEGGEWKGGDCVNQMLTKLRKKY